MTRNKTWTIRFARPGDEAEIVAMIRELAEFERAPDLCTVTQSQISTALFGADPTARCHIAEEDGRVSRPLVWGSLGAAVAATGASLWFAFLA